MADDIRLFIITDHPRRAALAVLCVSSLSDVPSFVRIVTEPAAIARLPDGARCIGRWYSARPGLAELAWIDRRALGGVEGISIAFQDRLNQWIDNRRAAEAAFVREVLGLVDESPAIPPAHVIPRAEQPRQRWS